MNWRAGLKPLWTQGNAGQLSRHLCIPPHRMHRAQEAFREESVCCRRWKHVVGERKKGCPRAWGKLCSRQHYHLNGMEAAPLLHVSARSLPFVSSLRLGIHPAGLPARNWKAPHWGPAQKDFYSTAEDCAAIAGTTTGWAEERGRQLSTQHRTPGCSGIKGGGGRQSSFPASALAGCLVPFSKAQSMKKQLSAAARSLAGSKQLHYVWRCTAFRALMNWQRFQKANSDSSGWGWRRAGTQERRIQSTV